MAKGKNNKWLSWLVLLVICAAVVIRYVNSHPTKASAAATSNAVAGRDDNMAMGNPSKANEDDKDNYLMVKPQYALAYNNTAGMANWVSWHLSTAWRGAVKRCNCFAVDMTLPGGFNAVKTSDYIRSGFDRGHLCPSDDRTATEEDNAATFLMTNMSPQAPFLNERTWERLEAYCRKLVMQGNELYIIAGGYGRGGEGKNGSADALGKGKINVPAHFWKIALVLPVGDNDVKRIAKDTRVIAIDMPNNQTVDEYEWGHYRTSVDAIEKATGYDFLSAVPPAIQDAIEADIDSGPVQ